MNSQALGQKVYNFCHTLRDDGVSYGDYLEQLTYLIFLKMAHEFAQPPFDRDLGVPREYQWPTLASKRGAELEAHYIAFSDDQSYCHPHDSGRRFSKKRD